MAHYDTAIIRIALPTAVECKGSATGADAHDHVREYLADVGGGWTEWVARGGWENDDGELVRERVRMYECALDGREGEPEHARMHARVLADELAFITTEDVIMWQVVPASHGFED